MFLSETEGMMVIEARNLRAVSRLKVKTMLMVLSLANSKNVQWEVRRLSSTRESCWRYRCR